VSELAENAFLSFTVGYSSDIWVTGFQFFESILQNFHRFQEVLIAPLNAHPYCRFSSV